MKIKLPALIFLFVTLFFYSCELGFGGDGGNSSSSTPRIETFRALNVVNNSFYNTQARLLYEGVRVNIWVELGSNVSQDTARAIANTYDNTIFERMMSAFNAGINFTDGGVVVARNPMELADYRGDGDGKLAILLLTIRDGYGEGDNIAFVGGYFNSIDLYINPNSNQKDMIYINTRLVQYGLDAIYDTIAHEMQHLMNYVISTSTIRDGRRMDIWINEGLSEAAQWIWSRRHTQERVDWFNADPLQTIALGNNFFVWGSRTFMIPDAILDDYATVYLFFQWLRLQAGGSTGIYRDILHSPFSDFRSVTSAANATMPGRNYDTWGNLLRTWLAANFINAPTGPYGYMNDPLLRDVRHKYYLSAPEGSSVPLFPGEGIFTQKTSLPSATTFIRYAGMPAMGSMDAPIVTGNTQFRFLLSYNIDTRSNGGLSSAHPFSVETVSSQSAISTSIVSGGLSQPFSLSGPFRISAWDMLRLNGHEENAFDLDHSKLYQRIEIGE
jgi:hypothetical protein